MRDNGENLNAIGAGEGDHEGDERVKVHGFSRRLMEAPVFLPETLSLLVVVIECGVGCTLGEI